MGLLWEYDFSTTSNCNSVIPPEIALSYYHRYEPQRCIDGTMGTKLTVRRYLVQPASGYSVTSSLNSESITYSNGCQ